MAIEFDIELSARLTLQELLLEYIFARSAATLPTGGAADVQEVREAMLKIMAGKAAAATGLTAEQRSEWAVNAATITSRFFDHTEQRRADIVRQMAEFATHHP
jgi:hypothetical protein